MKKNILIYFLLIVHLSVFSQQDDSCDINIQKAKKLLNDNSPFNDGDLIFDLVSPCALSGDANAQNMLGILYLNGVGTEVNIDEAFDVISSAANKGYPDAQYNLGRMYKEGTGCTISFDNAISWFEKAIENGHQRAAYSLGYMYYKGLGVQQSYEQAISLFEESEDPMAKHFLGLSHYQGYGTPVDEEKALEILLDNDTPNSASILTYIRANQREVTEEAVQDVLASNEEASGDGEETVAHLEETATMSVDDLSESEIVTAEDIVGSWVGKIVQYDWSGEKIERIIPIEISFDGSDVTYTFLGEEKNIKAQLQGDFMYFTEPFIFTLDKLYTSYPNELSLDYEVFSIDFKKQDVSGNTYLIGSVDTYIKNWKEYGQPTRIILRPKGTESSSEDDEVLLALASQEGQFIKLYPVPFVHQLTVQYELEIDATVYVELVSINGGNPIVIVPTTPQVAGEYTFPVAVDPGLRQGLYVVRIVAGNQEHTRLIIKSN